MFNAFGTKVQLFQSGPRIIPTEDEDVSAAVAEGLRRSGVELHESFGVIERFERTLTGIRMVYARDDETLGAEAELAVAACRLDRQETAALDLAAAGVQTDARGFIAVNEFQRTTAAHVSGGRRRHRRPDVLAPQAIQEVVRGGHQRGHRRRRDGAARGQSDPAASPIRNTPRWD